MELSGRKPNRKNGKWARYIDALFSFRDTSARVCPYQSLVLPLFDYCCPLTEPLLKGSTDGLEKCFNKFVKRSNFVYLETIIVTGWKNCGETAQVNTRLNKSLMLVYRLVFQVVSYGELLFAPYEPVVPAPSVSGNARNNEQLANHPYPIRALDSHLSGQSLPNSETSFAFTIAGVWNELTFAETANQSLEAFKSALDAVKCRSQRWIKSTCYDEHLVY